MESYFYFYHCHYLKNNTRIPNNIKPLVLVGEVRQIFCQLSISGDRQGVGGVFKCPQSTVFPLMNIQMSKSCSIQTILSGCLFNLFVFQPSRDSASSSGQLLPHPVVSCCLIQWSVVSGQLLVKSQNVFCEISKQTTS